jgi:hypothetical protein
MHLIERLHSINCTKHARLKYNVEQKCSKTRHSSHQKSKANAKSNIKMRTKMPMVSTHLQLKIIHIQRAKLKNLSILALLQLL